jgi:acyl-CoA hydrolase
MIWCLFSLAPFHLLSLVSLAEKAIMATPVCVSPAQSVVSFTVSFTSTQMHVHKHNESELYTNGRFVLVAVDETSRPTPIAPAKRA